MSFLALFVFLGLTGISSAASCEKTRLQADLDVKSFTSSNFPANYDPSKECSWIISSRYTSLNVQLKFVSFETEGTNGACTNTSDYLEIYDAYDDKSSKKLIGRYCGNPGNQTFLGTGTNYHLFVKFAAKSGKAKKGFKIEYSAVQDADCGPFILNAEVNKPKVLTSPNYPGNYPAKTKCSWLIEAPKDKYVKLNFTGFDVGSFDDKFGICHITNHTMKIFDNNQSLSIDLHLLGTYCGDIIPADVISTKRYLTLVFASSDSKNNIPSKKGFKLEYSALSAPASYYAMCSTLNSGFDPGYKSISLQATSTYQYISSPLYPNKYPSNLYCTWTITPSSDNKRIKLEVTDLMISNKRLFSCDKADYLKVTGGDNSAKYCDLDFLSTKSQTVISSGQRMNVVFQSDTNNYFRNETAGFKARFIEVEGNAGSLKNNVCVLLGIFLAQFLLFI